MGVTYEDLMKKVQSNRNSVIRRSLHKWSYSEPYKMIITDIKDQENGRLAITVAFEVDDSLVEKTFTFATEGKSSFFWEMFINKAFPGAEDVTMDMLLGRPFSAEIGHNDGFDNLTILSGYVGKYPDEIEGLS